MIRAPRVRTGCALGAVALTLALCPATAFAQSQERLSADVSATAGYSNNPFSSLGSDTGSALVTIGIAPRYQILTERSTVTLSGDANVQQYLRRYGRNDSYSGAVDYQTRPSERVTAHTRIDLSSAVLGSFNSYQPFAGLGSTTGTGTTTGTTTPVIPIPATDVSALPPLTDIGLYGLRNRRQTARLSGDVGLTLSAQDSLTVSGYTEATRYKGVAQFGDFEAYSGSLGYSRRVSERWNVGLRGSISAFDYRTAGGDSKVFPIEATVSGRLSQIWSIDGSVGVTFVDSDALGSTRQTSISGSLNLCRQGELSSLCLQGSRQVSPTGLVGSQYVTSAGLNWSMRLSERENLSLNGNYSKVGGNRAQALLPGLQSEFAQATAGYNRRVTERLGLLASANYRRFLSGNAGRPADFGGQIGISYRLGDVR